MQMKTKSTNPLYRLPGLMFIVTLLFGTQAWASVPAAPTNLTATGVSASQINLSWTDNATDESYFRVERSANGVTNWYMFTATSANVTTCSVTGLAANTTYYYRVRAEKVRVGLSDYSNVASATTSAARVALASPVLPIEMDEASVSTWPNPASDKVSVQINIYWQKGGCISLHSVTGDLLLKEKISGAVHSFDVSALPKGMYVIQLSNSTKRSMHKIFVQ
jgi:hypothetical protein